MTLKQCTFHSTEAAEFVIRRTNIESDIFYDVEQRGGYLILKAAHCQLFRIRVSPRISIHLSWHIELLVRTFQVIQLILRRKIFIAVVKYLLHQ